MAGMLRQSCRCGAVALNVTVPASSAGTRVVCYCKDCQTAARLHNGSEDMLSDAGGSHIWQTTPDHIDIVKGHAHLKILRLSPKGLFRWHAGCCGTPMMNTLPNLKLPFVGIVLRLSNVNEADQLLGRIACHASVASAIPGQGAPRKDVGFKRAGAGVLRRMILAWLSGRARLTPLIAENGTPIGPIEVISRDQRRAAIPDHLAAQL